MTFRDRIRKYLGITEAKEQITRLNEDLLAISLDVPSLTMFKAMEQKQAERHKEMMDALAVRGTVHSTTRFVTDYETSQVLALEEFKEKK